MKTTIKTILCLLLSACAEAEDAQVYNDPEDGGNESIELAQTQQALIQPDFYGVWGSGNKCGHPNQGSANCYLPSSRTRRMKFHASTCSSWWQARMVSAEQNYKNTVESAGWTYLSGGSSGVNINVRCDTTNKCTTAKACMTPITYTCSGGICKMSVVDVWVDVNEMEGADGDWNWATLTETQRQKLAQNTFVHEVGGHAFGLGHEFNELWGNDPDAPLTPITSNAMGSSVANHKSTWQNISQPHQVSDLTNYIP